MKTDILTLDAKKSGSLELSDSIFGLEPRADILHRMVVYQLAKSRAGTQSVQARSDVRGTRAKIYRQKGTGRARHGDKKANIFRGGGKAFAPKPRSHAIKLNKKVRSLALKCALSAKVKDNGLVVLENIELKTAKTKELKSKIDNLGLKSALIVDGAEANMNFCLASRNVHGVDVLPAQGINVYDILRKDKLVLTKSAVAAIEERLK